MKTLSLNIAKNTTISELACSPNTIVLAKQSIRIHEKTGDVSTSVRYIEVCQVEKTDPVAILQGLLKYIVAEFFVCQGLETDFAETNIKQRKLFNQFLSENTIYRTNSDGKIAKALISEVPLRQTALRVQKNHTIVLCKPENRKAAFYQHAKAIRAQCAYISLINDMAATFDKEAEKAETTTAPTTRRRTAPATTGTAPQPQA